MLLLLLGNRAHNFKLAERVKLLANYSLNCTLVSPITITNSASNSSEIKMKKIYIFKHNPNPPHPPPSPIPLALGHLPLTLKLTTPSLKKSWIRH